MKRVIRSGVPGSGVGTASSCFTSTVYGGTRTAARSCWLGLVSSAMLDAMFPLLRYVLLRVLVLGRRP
jgi:hypothetical protein